MKQKRNQAQILTILNEKKIQNHFSWSYLVFRQKKSQNIASWGSHRHTRFKSRTTEILMIWFSFWICSMPITVIDADRRCVAASLSGWEYIQKLFCTTGVSCFYWFVLSLSQREFISISPHIFSFYLVSKSMKGATLQSLDAVFSTQEPRLSISRDQQDLHTEGEEIQGLSSSLLLLEIRGPVSCTSVFTSIILLTFLRLFLIYDTRRLKWGSGSIASCWNPQREQILHYFTSEQMIPLDKRNPWKR